MKDGPRDARPLDPGFNVRSGADLRVALQAGHQEADILKHVAVEQLVGDGSSWA